MALDTVSPNTTRSLSVGDHADFTRPNSDSCVIALVRPASDTGYVISSGTWSDAATFTMYFFNSYNVQGTYGAVTAATSSPLTANTWNIVFNRRLSNSFDVGWINVGGSSVTKSGGAAVSTSLDGTTLNMLADGSGDASTWGFDGVFQYLAMINGAVTDNDLIALANGAQLFTMPFAKDLVEVWHAKNSSLGITGLIKGHAATKNGTGYADFDDVMPLYSGRVLYIHRQPGGAIVLTVANTTQSQASNNLSLTQANTLAIADSAQSQTSDSVTLGLSVQLSVADSAQTQEAEHVELTQNYVLIVSNTLQTQISDNIGLLQSHILEVDDSTQAQVTDGVTLSTAVVLALQDSGQAQLSESIGLIQQNVLTLQDSNQSQIMDNVTLATGIVLSLAQSAQSQGSDNVALTQANILQIFDSEQSQVSDNVALTQANTLAISDSIQAQVSENIELSLSIVLDPADMAQNQTMNNVELTQNQMLAVQSTIQSQLSENINLVQGSVLAVADSIQTQKSDSIQWIVIVTPDSRIYAVRGKNRVYSVN